MFRFTLGFMAGIVVTVLAFVWLFDFEIPFL